MKKIIFGGMLLPLASIASAQIDRSSEIRTFSEKEIAEIPIPDTQFDVRRARVADFEKYYYFHRDDTSFNEAFADISECDQLAAGLTSGQDNLSPYPDYYISQYGIGGVIGGAVGSFLGDAIHGSAARREMRRVNMRNCMGYKGYQRYGIPKNLWADFNFEEGGGRKKEDERAAALMQQARVASGAKPTTGVLER